MKLVHPAPSVIADLWPTVRAKRSPARWDGIEPEGALVIYWTPEPIKIQCGECGKSLGLYRAYQAGGEYGIVADTPRRYHSPNRYPTDTLKHMPNDRAESAGRVYWITGHTGFRASKTFAHFRCTICRVEYEENLRRLGLHLWHDQPEVYRVTNAIRRG